MAKKQSTKPEQSAKPEVQVVPINTGLPETTTSSPSNEWSIYGFKMQAVIVAVLAFIFYINTYKNEYAHDDGIVIVKNEYVQEGISGIYKILSRDAYDSYYRQLNTINQLKGGRFRPLSIVTFAIEQEFLGAIKAGTVDSVLKQNISYGVHGKQEEKLERDMHVRHVFNVLWYVLSVVVLLYFLRYVVLKNSPIIALLAAILFTIHPIHTEVVANVKSRDEIMSLLFMSLTFIYTFKYQEFGKKWMLWAALGSYFLAFLSKEYAITMAVLLPLSLYLFNGNSIKKSIITFLPFMAVIGLYLAIRLSIVTASGENSDSEVLNNPYLFASVGEKLATEIATSLNYLKLLVWPHPLSADYSYNSIPYKGFNDPIVWLSALIYGAITVSMFLLFPKKQPALVKVDTPIADDYKSILCFAIAYYLAHFILICNIVFDIGATMGERLIYHSSVGFAIALAYFIYMAFQKIKPEKTALAAMAGFMVIMIVAAGYKTITRNAEWVNDNTLFSADLKVVPNSVLVLGNVAAADVTQADFQADSTKRKEYLYKAIELLDHALTIHNTFVAGYLNRGIAYYKLGLIDKAKENVDKVAQLYPTYPTLPGMYKLISDFYMKRAWNEYGRLGKYPEALVELKKGLSIDSTNAELWYNTGGAYYSNHQLMEAIYAWQRALKLKPDYVQAQQGLGAALNNLKMMNGGQAAPGVTGEKVLLQAPQNNTTMQKKK